MADRRDIDLHDLINPDKFIPVYLERHDKELITLPPYSVELHLTSICNYNCYHCSYANRNKMHLFLPEEIVERLIQDLTTALKPRGVYFSGGGEPTTLKNWANHIECFIKNDVEVALITNGSLIREEHLPILSQLNYIAISIYSTKEDIYKKITGGTKFRSSFELPSLIKSQNGKVIVGARCVINKFNYFEIIKIYEKAMNSGYDYIIFIPEIDYENRGIVLTKEQIDTLMQLVDNADIDIKKTNLLDLYNRKFSYYPADMTFASNTECNAIKLRTNAFVNYDGGIWLCQPHIGKKEYCIGNLYKKDFKDIWNSKQHLAVIEKLQKEWKSGLCQNCRSIPFNRAVYNFIANNKPSIKVIEDPFV